MPRYIGIDVHKDTNSAFMFYRNEEGYPCFYEIGTISAGTGFMIRAVRRALKNCEIEDYDVLAGYEAGPTGYGLFIRLKPHLSSTSLNGLIRGSK